jgi:phosphoribosylamine--glycine ligase
MMELAEGTDAENIIPNMVATGVVMAIPDFPYSHATKKETCDIPIYGLEDPPDGHFHPCEVMRGVSPHMVDGAVKDKKCFVTGGDYVLVISGTGETISQSAKAAYANLKKISIPASPIYRTDISKRLKKQLPVLQALGFAKDWEY